MHPILAVGVAAAVAVTEAMGIAAAVIALLMLGTWAASLALRNASIVDVVWGLGFVAVALAVRVAAGGGLVRRDLLVAMAAVWGLRLAGYLLWRNAGKGEDFRYAAMRRRLGPRFPLVSLLTVFAVQGALMWVVSLPLQLGQVSGSPDTFWPPVTAGVALWAVGLLFESVGDAQLARFKADPSNQGRVMDRGLWRYTRHPNYFGDCCVWWGIWLAAGGTSTGVWSLPGPVVMTVLLLRVSGVALLERSIGRRRPGYDDYVRRTSAFFPRPPRP